MPVKKIQSPKSSDVINHIKKVADKQKAHFLQRYFKTARGEYGEGDVFWGIYSTQIKETVKKFQNLPFREIEKLIKHRVHEVRATALLLLVMNFIKEDERGKEKIVKMYLRNTGYINNWDLVDMSAHKIIGEYLADKTRHLLYKLASSGYLWEERIAVVACLAFIKRCDFRDIINLCEMFLNHKQDLIHKACGWMLRETGKRNIRTLETFLKKHYKKMPRTMLRYAIEKFPPRKRNAYLKG